MPMLIRKPNQKGGHHYQLCHMGLTAEEVVAQKQGRLEICIRDVPPDIAALPLDRIMSAYERARMQANGEGENAA